MSLHTLRLPQDPTRGTHRAATTLRWPLPQSRSTIRWAVKRTSRRRGTALARFLAPISSSPAPSVSPRAPPPDARTARPALPRAAAPDRLRDLVLDLAAVVPADEDLASERALALDPAAAVPLPLSDRLGHGGSRGRGISAKGVSPRVSEAYDRISDPATQPETCARGTELGESNTLAASRERMGSGQEEELGNTFLSRATHAHP